MILCKCFPRNLIATVAPGNCQGYQTPAQKQWKWSKCEGAPCVDLCVPPNCGVCCAAGRCRAALRGPQTALHKSRVNNQYNPSPFPLEVCPTCFCPLISVLLSTLLDPCLLPSQACQPPLPLERTRQPSSTGETCGVRWAGQLPRPQQGRAVHAPCTELFVM